MSNFNHNSNPKQKVNSEQENLGVSINLRFPGRSIATGISIVVAFAGGMNVSSIQNHSPNLNNVDCSVKSSLRPIQQSPAK